MKTSGLVLIASFLALSFGCRESDTSEKSNHAGSATQPTTRLRVGMMPKLVGIGYFNAVEQGAKEAADELGIDLVYDGPSTQSHDQQVQKIETWIAKKFDVIALAPNDPQAMAPTIKKARDRGIHVLTFDADAENSAREFFINQATYDAVAKSLMDLMHDAVGDNGKYVILTGNLTAANQNIWMDRMKAYREKTYPKMIDLSEGKPYETKEDRTMAKRVCMDVLDARGSELQGVFAITSTALPGAAEAVAEKKAADKVFLTGLATPDEMRQYVKDGTVKKFALWSPVDLGYLTVHAAKLITEGNLKEGTIQAGRLKTITVKNKEVLLGPPLVFTKDNIDQYHF